MMRTVSIPITDEVFYVLRKDVASIQSDIMKSLAIQYFREMKLSLGLSAKMAGMTKNDFVDLLGRNSVDIYQYTDEELQEEFDLVDRIAEGLN
jgi:predicted HTH domain antitoxin